MKLAGKTMPILVTIAGKLLENIPKNFS